MFVSDLFHLVIEFKIYQELNEATKACCYINRVDLK